MKEFNTTGLCNPDKHYMVDITDRLVQIKKMIDKGNYFTINRSRQYGKTTTLTVLKRVLKDEYIVVSLDFQGIGNAGFETEKTFVKSFSRMLIRNNRTGDFLPHDIEEQFADYVARKDVVEQAQLDELFATLMDWCYGADKPIVMMIDEVDSATNNQVFLDFLAQLRLYYLNREGDAEQKTFQSVILAGVTDVKHLKSRIRDEDQHKVNSPWNIAEDFNIDMSLSAAGIKGMLDDYEADHNTGMNTRELAEYIREYTSGYPFLVSRICQMIDTALVPDPFDSYNTAWTIYGVDEAVKKILSERNTLFESLMGKLTNYPELKKQLRNILLRGEAYAWLPYDEEQQQLSMYGFISNNHNTVSVSNRIFEMLIYTHFVGESDKDEDLRQFAAANKQVFVDEDGWLDVRKIMEHFIVEHNRIHGADSEKFVEDEGRERFLTYLAPIINGTGTYSIEEQTRTHKRMDVIIHYLGRKYVIELKIWRGERYNADGEKQISEYLDYFDLDTGYMLSFNFNKNKKSGVERVNVGNKVLFEGTV